MDILDDKEKVKRIISKEGKQRLQVAFMFFLLGTILIGYLAYRLSKYK